MADNSKPFFIFTEASNDAVGSALCQFSTTDNLYHPVCYHSHKLNKAEKNYSVTDREALALVDAVRTFKGYLPMQFTVYSDHEPLTFINRMAAKNQRIMRWSLELAPYDIVVKHIKGISNCLADFLSR